MKELGYLQISHARVEKRAGVQFGCSPHHSTDTIEVASEVSLRPICKMPPHRLSGSIDIAHSGCQFVICASLHPNGQDHNITTKRNSSSSSSIVQQYSK